MTGWAFAELFKDSLKPLHLVFSLPLVHLESLLYFRAARFFGLLSESFDEFLFGVEHVAEFVQK